MSEKLSVFDKINAIFQHRLLSKEEFGRDGYRILQIMSMNPKYTQAMNSIQRYVGVLGFRIQYLLHEICQQADAAPFMAMIKKEGGTTKTPLSEPVQKILCQEYKVSKKRLKEYLPNIWITDEDIKEAYGI